MLHGKAPQHLRHWPVVDVGNGPVRGDIKKLSVADLARLTSVARDMPWSANGRPEWLHERRSDIARVFLIVYFVESPSVYRCLAIAFTDNKSAWTFTIDVAFRDFDTLPSLLVGELVELTQSLLYGFPMLPLDPVQEEHWKTMEDDVRKDKRQGEETE